MATILALLTPEFLVALAVALAAGLMRGFAGFGSGMLMAPIFAILFGPVATVGIIILMEICVTAQLLPGTRRDIEWRFIVPMVAVAGLFMPVGSWLLVSVDTGIMTRAIAAIVLLFSIILMTGWRHAGEKRLAAAVGVGAFSGAMMAATSLGNPPVMLYLLSSRDTAATNRANVTGYFAITLTILIAVMAFSGLLSWPTVWRATMLLPVFMLAAWIGSRLFRQSGEALYRRVALAFLFAVGLYGLVR